MVLQPCEIARNLSVRACQTEKRKVGMISLSVVLPIDRETTYLTSLLLSVLHRGTERYPTIEALNRRLDYLFGTEMSIRNHYCGDMHVIGISADLLGEEYLPRDCDVHLMRDVLEVMREILFHPATDDEGLLLSRYVESEKQLQIDAIRSLRNSPRAYAVKQFSERFYENEPCGVPICGTEEQIEAITPRMLTERWRELLKAIKLECFYIGPESTESVCGCIKDILLPELEAVRRALPACKTVAHRAPECVRRCESDLPVSQGQLIVGLQTGVTVCDRDYFAAAVANEMLGVSPVSRLFVHVREKRGLCYHCSSHYNIYKGTILISCGLLPKNRQEAEDEILAQIDVIKNGGFTDRELEAAKRSLEASYRQIEDKQASLESFFFGRALHGLEASLEESRRGFAAVEREDILRVAAGWTTDTVYFLNGTLPSDGEEAEYGND